MKAFVAFFVDRPVLVGLLMLTVIGLGAYSALTLTREMFPESRPDRVLVSVPYPGAMPAEIEKAVALRAEEAVKSVAEVEKIITQITEGSCVIVAELRSDVRDLDQVVNDVQAAVDAIPRDELPDDVEQFRVRKLEPRLPVISLTMFGDVDERTLKALGERMRSEILLLPGVTDIEVGGLLKGELSVEVQPEKLIEYQTSLTQIADAIRQTNLDLPAGQIETDASNVAVRTVAETDAAARIAETVVRTGPGGREVRVRDLGAVIDGFENDEVAGYFNGKRAVSVTVYKIATQDAIDISAKVRAFAAGKRGQPMDWGLATRVQNAFGVQTAPQAIYDQARRDPYPKSVTLQTHSNLARFIEDRLELLIRNGAWGAAFVFLSLLLFLNWRVSVWVMAGMVVAVCGAGAMMKLSGVTLNLITMFGLIVVLGMVVDDAIVVGENIYARVERGEVPRRAAVEGASEVAWPVVVTVTTTIGAFLPLMFIEGQIGDFMGVLPVVVACTLSMSLLEALTLLPGHLADSLRPHAPGRSWVVRRLGSWGARLRDVEQHIVLDVLRRYYERLLIVCAEYRYITMALVLALLIGALGLVAGNRVPFVFVQKMDSETLLADLEMPVGTPAERTRAAIRVVEQACLDAPEVRNLWSIVGAQIDADEGGAYTTVRSHTGQVIIELSEVEERDRSSDEILAEFRRKTAAIPGISALRYRSMQGGPAGAEIQIEVTCDRTEDALAAAGELRAALEGYSGVYDIDDDYDTGRRELQVEPFESARALGVTTRSLATEIRGAFYGLEARTLQRGRDDVDVRVRFAEDRRRELHELEQMRIATPRGMVPISELAGISEVPGTASVRRVNQRRAVVVTADVDQARGNSEQILADLLPLARRLESRSPGLRIEYAGAKRETSKALGSLKQDFLVALALIYATLAGLFRSYIQPMIVMLAIPCGVIGSVAGHLIMGYPMTILSAIGLVAVSGVVVNDALVLVDFINNETAAGKPARRAVVDGGVRRLRAILLTTITTILGLGPLLAEQSFQARFLIPMAISITFGLGFATMMTLVTIPSGYLMVEDLKALLRRVRGSDRPRSEAPAVVP